MTAPLRAAACFLISALRTCLSVMKLGFLKVIADVTIGATCARVRGLAVA